MNRYCSKYINLWFDKNVKIWNDSSAWKKIIPKIIFMPWVRVISHLCWFIFKKDQSHNPKWTMLIMINKRSAIIGNCIQKKITAIEITVYQKVKIKNFFLDWYPKRAATAPSKEPWGTPINETRHKAIKDKILNSYILGKNCSQITF